MDSRVTTGPPVIEWLTSPQGSQLLEGPPRIGFGAWGVPDKGLAPGLWVEVRDEPTQTKYNVWLPESEAVEVRDKLLEWWPLSRFPYAQPEA